MKQSHQPRSPRTGRPSYSERTNKLRDAYCIALTNLALALTELEGITKEEAFDRIDKSSMPRPLAVGTVQDIHKRRKDMRRSNAAFRATFGISLDQGFWTAPPGPHIDMLQKTAVILGEAFSRSQLLDGGHEIDKDELPHPYSLGSFIYATDVDPIEVWPALAAYEPLVGLKSYLACLTKQEPRHLTSQQTAEIRRLHSEPDTHLSAYSQYEDYLIFSLQHILKNRMRPIFSDKKILAFISDKFLSGQGVWIIIIVDLSGEIPQVDMIETGDPDVIADWNIEFETLKKRRNR